MIFNKAIPTGSGLEAYRQSSEPKSIPKLPASWAATVLLSPFGDSISPLENSSQLTVGSIETSYTPAASFMRIKLYLTQDQRCFDFVFMTTIDADHEQRSRWYWVDADLDGGIKDVFGPFPTTLVIPGPTFFADRAPRWGNAYPLMCNEKNPTGIACDHWVMKPPSVTTHGVWCTFRQDTGHPFRIFTMDVTNPLMIPVLGSFYIVNIPTFRAAEISKDTANLVERIRKGGTAKKADYWNPMVTQEDVQRAMALPLASAHCTPEHIQAVIPGFTAMPGGGLPRWSDKTYAEGWTIAVDFIPYCTRIRYLWTGKADSKQQSIFIGQSLAPGQGSYMNRRDVCLDLTGAVQPTYEWKPGHPSWQFKECLQRNPPVGILRPNWLELNGASIMGRIEGNPDFGLAEGQAIDLVATTLSRGRGELAIFWVWFFGNGDGMLFSEGNFLYPLSHNLQLIDYVFFEQDADLTQEDFSNPCAPPAKSGGLGA